MFAFRFLYPGIGSVILKSFVCVRIGKQDVLLTMVDVICWSGEYWRRVGITAVVASVVILISVPLAQAIVVLRDQRFLREQQRREGLERQAALQRMFKRLSVMDRLRLKASSTKIAYRRQAVDMRSAVIRRFIAMFQPRYWWWFLVEMLMCVHGL